MPEVAHAYSTEENDETFDGNHRTLMVVKEFEVFRSILIALIATIAAAGHPAETPLPNLLSSIIINNPPHQANETSNPIHRFRDEIPASGQPGTVVSSCPLWSVDKDSRAFGNQSFNSRLSSQTSWQLHSLELLEFSPIAVAMLLTVIYRNQLILGRHELMRPLCRCCLR